MRGVAAAHLGADLAQTRPSHHEGNSANNYGPTHHVVFPVMAEGDIFPELLANPDILAVLTGAQPPHSPPLSPRGLHRHGLPLALSRPLAALPLHSLAGH